MSKFLELYGDDPIVQEAMVGVEEGIGLNKWIYFFTNLAVGPITSTLVHKFAFNELTVKKLSQNKEFREYIKTKSEEIIKKLKKTDSTITTDVEEWEIGDLVGRAWQNVKAAIGNPFEMAKHRFNARWQTKIDKYLISFYGVGDAVDTVYLWFRSQKSGLFVVEIPAPDYENKFKY